MRRCESWWGSRLNLARRKLAAGALASPLAGARRADERGVIRQFAVTGRSRLRPTRTTISAGMIELGHRLISVRFARIGLIALAIAGAAPGARAGDAAAGRTTYLSICSSCHGMNGIGNLEYVPSFSKCQNLNQPDARLLVSVRDGVGGRMPPWGVYLSEREILDAIAYARTFCKR